MNGTKSRPLGSRAASSMYAPALPYIRECQPEVHHHVIAYRGGLAADPFERFDTREEAEAFASDKDMVRVYGNLETIECRKALQIYHGKGKKNMTTTTMTRIRPRSLRSVTTRLNTEFGKLYVTVAVDEEDRPYEVFGRLGKGRKLPERRHGAGLPPYFPPPTTGNASRRGHPPVPGESRRCSPSSTAWPMDASVPVLGIGDGIAHVLRDYLEYRGPRKHVEAGKAMAMA